MNFGTEEESAGWLYLLRKALNRWNSLRRAHVTILGHFHEFQDPGRPSSMGRSSVWAVFAANRGGAGAGVARIFIIDKDRGKRCVSLVMVG